MATLLHRARTGSGSLWQGGAEDVMNSGDEYDIVVLCADEFQPKRSLILRPEDKTTLLYAPNDDSGTPLSKAQADIACLTAKRVAQEYKAGKKILVSCMQGRNRSGLVSALSLHLLYGMGGKASKEFIQAKIPYALANTSFNRFLGVIQPRRSASSIRMTGFRNGRDGRDD